MTLKAALIALMLTAAPASSAEPLRVLATIGMIGDIAANVGGDCVAVQTLVGPGADPHLFTPAPTDLRKLQQAEVILYAGLHLEGQLGEVLEKLSKKRPVVALSELSVAPDQVMQTGDQPDPHIWMDVALWRQIVPHIAASIIQMRPDCAEGISQNSAKVAADLQALDAWARASVQSIPQNQRHLITAHDAFGYFGRAYGIEVSAIQGISTQAEAAIADIEAIASLITQSGVPAVFVESTINPRTIQALSEAVQAKGGLVTIAGELFADSMGAAGSDEGTYSGMIRHNISTIVPALGGTLAQLPPL